jgi:uncharacterized protein (TIGR02246 family)
VIKISAPSIAVMLALLAGCAQRAPRPDTATREECHPISDERIAGLFKRWNDSLQTRDAGKVVANYAEGSVLLPTLSARPRVSRDDKEEYFEKHFLPKGPSGSIDWSVKRMECNTAIDSGLYTFTFSPSKEIAHARYTFTYHWSGGRWLITSHHSSLQPPEK